MPQPTALLAQVLQLLQDTRTHAGTASKQDDVIRASWDVLIKSCFSEWIELVGSGLVTSEELDDLDVVEQGFLIVDEVPTHKDQISEPHDQGDDINL